MRIDRLHTLDAMHGVALFPILVTFVECNAIRKILDRATVEIDFEFIHAFRMIDRHRNGAED
jgi:hypothetical protein